MAHYKQFAYAYFAHYSLAHTAYLQNVCIYNKLSMCVWDAIVRLLSENMCAVYAHANAFCIFA